MAKNPRVDAFLSRTARGEKAPEAKRETRPALEPDSDLLDRATREATAPGMLGLLLWLDDQLAARRFPAMSAFWKESLRLFFASGKRFGVWLVGRGGAKSSTLVRVATTATLFTPREIPPGQRWIWPFISISTPDAQRRIIEIQSILSAIEVTPTKVLRGNNPSIELDDVRGNPVAFMAMANTIRGVSGPSTLGGTIDEEAKLFDRVENANPSTEIIASMAQTFRAREGIFAIRCSSAYGVDGSHAAAIREGDTLTNYVARLGAFLSIATDGLLEVAAWEAAQGRGAAAAQIREHAAKLTETSPEIPTWVGNPTIGAMASRIDAAATPAERLGGMSHTEYWLRENCSVARLGADAGAHVDQCADLADAVRKLNAPKGVLGTWSGLPASDPRSSEFGRKRRTVM